MNTKNLSGIIADPIALAELQKCTSVNEMVARLNKAGAECTREEGLRFLRVWEDMASSAEELSPDELSEVAGGGNGIIGFIRSIFSRNESAGHKLPPESKPDQLTIERILNRMNG